MTVDSADSRLPLVQYWHSPTVPTDVARMIATFEDRNPDLRHMLFDRAGAESLIGEHLSTRELAAFRACAVPAMQADYFRYCAGFVLGGICCDVDYYCARSLGPLIAGTNSGLLFQTPNQTVHNGFVVFPSSGHPLLRLALDVATANIERRTWEDVWWMTGPGVCTVLWALHKYGSFDAVRERAAARGVEADVLQVFPAVGEYTRVTEAFTGIRISPFAVARVWLQKPETPPRYKQGPLHWNNWQHRGNSILHPIPENGDQPLERRTELPSTEPAAS